MRTIKFRGKDIKTGKWFYGNYYDRDTKGNTHIANLDEGCLTIDPETVGQYTGLKDKNDKPIYEGDIVECVSWNEYFTNPATGEVMQPFRRKMYVDFRKGGFKMVEPMPYGIEVREWDIIYNGDIEIIGNIYDNPELLNKED